MSYSQAVEKTLRVINDLQQSGVIQSYALGGAMALLFYAEPALTFDVDVFIFLPGDEGVGIVDLGPIYQTLKNLGYEAQREHVLIAGVPVQFIPVYNDLVKEAVKQAVDKEYQGIPTRVMRLEHLLAIMIATNRPKDRERIATIVENIDVDRKSLDAILNRHALRQKWRKIIAKAK